MISAASCRAPQPASGAGLRVEHIHHRYDLGDGRGFSLEDVSLQVPPGAVHCLLGPSGSGKSTVLRLIAGLERARAGIVALDDQELSGPDRFVPPERRSMGLMFQDVALFPHMTVARNVGFGLRTPDARVRERRVGELLALVGLAGHAAKFPHELSGGEQQRAALARALAASPRAVLLDEAFSALDPSLRAEVRASVLTILRHAGIPVLMVTHDPDEAIAEADRIHVIEDGRITQSGTVGQLYRMPETRFVAGFFGPVLRFCGSPEQGCLATPIGPIPIEGDTQSDVEVILRTRDLTPVALGKSPWRATVLACRDLGDRCRVELAAKGNRLGDIHVPGEVAHRVGGEIGLAFAPESLFVFPDPAVLNGSRKGGIVPAPNLQE
ncbi:ABC transporter ATP-binding protein [Geminicoccus roseus]|uniref:ABC transporter ATP-binding protein n=1 Tax=Geminicoccus roseus TaxID=404900 RepID=UPI0004086BF5|nr:ABC transporter ATP-binding protein [Geminicoccus roseus]